ncbi:GlsB/YeaQ/YmgE family stress response membrane protein [Gimesia sp.]|uniref:GlsB/YeaQ/YmgE family stress response membrane protein n=1 Tax=Gimesia sp. TaxID=2024833 RepID=UPI003A8D1C2E
MGIFQFFLLLLVAAICGGIAQSLAGYSRGGCLTSIALGFIGALLGTWLSGTLGLPELLTVEFGDQPFPILWSIIGAALFVSLLSLISFRKK